ncbi:MAG: NAD(P)/FAD-dependent oxidoreductase [Candidatus Aminicenantes bacterium]|nr:NAD(P)/FAD-dependent oxidoreductase [Candidatus Aminicenantes bacterium]
MTLPVAIIGAGPAGIAAAVQLQRGGVDFRLLEKERIGGLLHEAQRVENFPGVAGGLSGRALAARLRRQLAASGIRAEKARAIRLALRNGRFAIHTAGGVLTAARVILACGTVPLSPKPPLDPERMQGRLFCSVLPLLRVRGETIAIIGGGDAAFDYALSLAPANRVHILVRSERPRALPLLVERCRRQRGIVIHQSCRLTHAEVRQGGARIFLAAQAFAGGHCGEIACQRILSAIGREPALHFLDADLRAVLPELERSKRVFLTGDVGNGRFRQAAIAAASGLRAAMEIQAGGSACA